MNTLELFEYTDFKGDSKLIEQDNPDLSSVGFHDKAQSLRVKGDPWIVFSEDKYQGTFECFCEGNYSSIPSFSKKINSARIVRGGLYNPKIVLFEHIHYAGKQVTTEKAVTSLKSYKMDNMASSHKTISGAWKLYSEEYYKGEQMITVAGDNIADYRNICWNDKVSSLKPIVPDEASE